MDLTVEVPVNVTTSAAPPGTLAYFPSPSTDRLQAASPLPGGLPGSRLTDELVITLGTDDAPGTRADADAIASATGAVVSGGASELGIYTIRWAEQQDLDARRNQLLTFTGVTDVSYHDVGTVSTEAAPPGDWDDDGHEVTWPFTQINAQQAWNSQHGGLVKMGIIDGARVQGNHEDLNVVKKLGDFGPAAHATHVAGLACARANGIGVVGVAWGCPIVTIGLPAKPSDLDVITAAILVVQEPGVKIINMSIGRGLDSHRCATVDERNLRLVEAQRNAVWFKRLFNGFGKNVVWTIAAGNECEDIVSSAWGQNGDLPNVITVGASNSDGSLARLSSFGTGVEVAAPGGVDVEPPRNGTIGLWSTWLYGFKSSPECGPAFRYCWDYGTSMAAPVVAGIAELLRSAYPNASAAKVAQCIVSSASGSATQSAYPNPNGRYTPHIMFSEADALPIVDAEAALTCAGAAGQLSDAVKVAVSNNQVCALITDGTIKCWGGDRTRAAAVPGITTAVDVTAGIGHACAVLSSGSVRCWGGNSRGQLGNGAVVGDGCGNCDSATPVAVTGLTDAVAVAASTFHTCALRTGGSIKCWGEWYGGQLGDGSTNAPDSCTGGGCAATPVQVAGIADAKSIGDSCAVRVNGEVKCWGSNAAGELGIGTFPGPSSCGAACSNTPLPVAGITTAAQVTVGGHNVCARLTSGHVMCWGGNERGQLGIGTSMGPFECSSGFVYPSCNPTPVEVVGITDATQVSSFASPCVVHVTGTLSCWGENESGRLGLGTHTGPQICRQPVPCSDVPVAVPNISNATQVSTTFATACAVLRTRRVMCTGENGGKLGNGTSYPDSDVPVPVLQDE